MKRVPTPLRLEATLKAKAQKRATKENRSLANLIEVALAYYMDNVPLPTEGRS